MIRHHSNCGTATSCARGCSIGIKGLLSATAITSAMCIGLPAMAETLDEIIVTSMKREQSALDVPASISVFSDATLSRDQLFNIEDLVIEVPNVNIAEFGDGQYRLIYRGIGATGTSDNQNFNTAIDGVIVPYNRAYRLLDLDRVEILRGPQGTLYGRNTNAGVINVVTRDGRDEFGGFGSYHYGNGDRQGFHAAIGGPVDDSGAFFRVAGRGYHTNGFHSNRMLNINSSHELNDYTIRGTAGIEDGPWLFKTALTYDRYYGNADNLVQETTPFSSIAPDLSTSDGQLLLPIVTLAYEGDSFDFTSISAYASADRIIDVSAVLAPVLIGQRDRYDSFSQEFRFNGNTSFQDRPLDWIGGLYFLHEENTFRSQFKFTPFDLITLDQVQYENTVAVAAFGELVYDWSPHWQTTVGLRVAYENQDVDFQLAAGAPIQNSDEDYTSVQPKFVVAYKPDDKSQIYASATRGFRAGSIFVNNAITNPSDPNYDQENIWQYELGYKGVEFDGGLTLEASVFYIDWSDLQAQRSVVVSTAPFTIATVVDNASSARSWGGEYTLSVAASDELTLFSSGGYTNAEYEDFLAAPGVDFSGNRIELVPEYSVGGGFNYAHPAGVELNFDVTHIGTMEFDAANTSAQGPYTLVDASLAYEIKNVRLAVIGRNLLDEEYATRGIVAAGQTFVQNADPLTVSGEVTLRF